MNDEFVLSFMGRMTLPSRVDSNTAISMAFGPLEKQIQEEQIIIKQRTTSNGLLFEIDWSDMIKMIQTHVRQVEKVQSVESKDKEYEKLLGMYTSTKSLLTETRIFEMKKGEDSSANVQEVMSRNEKVMKNLKAVKEMNKEIEEKLKESQEKQKEADEKSKKAQETLVETLEVMSTTQSKLLDTIILGEFARKAGLSIYYKYCDYCITNRYEIIYKSCIH